MLTEAHLFSMPNDCLWYDKLWGPSQRVVTLFKIKEKTKLHLVSVSSLTKGWLLWKSTSKEFCNICARQMYYQGCEGVTISMNYPPPRLQGLGQTGFDRAYLEEGEGGLEGAWSGEGGGWRRSVYAGWRVLAWWRVEGLP